MHIKTVRAVRRASPHTHVRTRTHARTRPPRPRPPTPRPRTHASQIELHGFKSYKEASISEPFSPGINVVVGANGSGKSNFFHGERAACTSVLC